MKHLPTEFPSIADQLEERLVNFAVRIIKLSACLPGLRLANTLLAKFYGLAHHRHQTTGKQKELKVVPTSFTR